LVETGAGSLSQRRQADSLSPLSSGPRWRKQLSFGFFAATGPLINWRSRHDMDPLSIAVGAASLATTCTRVRLARSVPLSAGVALILRDQISFFLYHVINTTRKVHSTLAALCNDINSLSGLLESVSNTLQSCQALALQHVDKDLWHRIHASLEDCRSTLEFLEAKVNEIQGTPETSAILKTRPALQLKLSWRSDEISGYRERIRKCNCAMQMAFQVINV
jgi:hypothetical protein